MYEVRSKPNCIYCFRALALLMTFKKDFTKVRYDSESDKDTMRKEGHKTWPMIYKDGKYIGGYSDLLFKLTGAERF